MRVWIWSLRTIKDGEEITINYGKEYIGEHFDLMGCECRVCVTKLKSKAGSSKVNRKCNKK